MNKQNLYDKVYEIVKQIPKGYVTTYQDIAIKLGNKNYARVVENGIVDLKKYKVK